MISKNLQIFGLQPQFSKVFFRSLEHFFLTVCQNNLGNKIPVLTFLHELLVFCYQNCSDSMWEKNVLMIEKNFWNLRLKAKNLQNFWDHLNNLFKLWKVRTISGKGSFTNYVYKRRGVGGPKKSWTFYWFWFLPEEKPLLSWVSLFQKLVQNMNLWTPQMNTNINQVHICNVKCTLELIKQFMFVSPHM